MGFIDQDALDKEVLRIEKDYPITEREFLIKILQERINNSKAKLRQDEVMDRTFKRSGFSRLSKMLGSGEQ